MNFTYSGARSESHDAGRPAVSGDARDVVLIGFQDQGNLGMGYLAAVLQENGYSVELLDYRDGPQEIIKRVRAADPCIVGFSLIFQYYLPGFRRLAQELRSAGVRSHFTIGGHYPSLCHDEVLVGMPELNSVVRFEGEQTLLDLTCRLTSGRDWHDVPGLAYLAGSVVVESSPRALVHDLESLPWPYRPHEPEDVVGMKALPILASRGCARRCSFCSIHTFYRTAPGKVVRVRDADKVVDEMQALYRQLGVRIFLFQDDDFPLWGRAGHKWVEKLAQLLERSGLDRRVIWKISCRAEYVESDLFARLSDVGLYLVYMGLESGTDGGLEILNKQMSVEANRHAIKTLKSIGLMFEYGFMLFDPSSTFASIRSNVDFLRTIVGDGSSAAVFCRMLPYGGTPIRDQLRMEGRLHGDVTRPDYDFLDRRLNEYHTLLDKAVAGWIHGHGISHQINWAWNELEILDRLVGGLDGLPEYRTALRSLTATSNSALFSYVERTCLAFKDGDRSELTPSATASIRERLHDELMRLRNGFVLTNSDRLLDAAATTQVTGPILAPQIF